MSMIFLWSMMAYGMTTILVYGSIFERARMFIKMNSGFFGDLISCVLCTSTWVGFFMSLLLGGLTVKYFDINPVVNFFFDGMATAGLVWAINGIVEFFEENRIK